jgi:hypothetical protein
LGGPPEGGAQGEKLTSHRKFLKFQFSSDDITLEQERYPHVGSSGFAAKVVRLTGHGKLNRSNETMDNPLLHFRPARVFGWRVFRQLGHERL